MMLINILISNNVICILFEYRISSLMKGIQAQAWKLNSESKTCLYACMLYYMYCDNNNG